MPSTFHQFSYENTGQLFAAAGGSLERHLSAALRDPSKRRMKNRKAVFWRRADTALREWEGHRIVAWDPSWGEASCFEVEADSS